MQDVVPIRGVDDAVADLLGDQEAVSCQPVQRAPDAGLGPGRSGTVQRRRSRRRGSYPSARRMGIVSPLASTVAGSDTSAENDTQVSLAILGASYQYCSTGGSPSPASQSDFQRPCRWRVCGGIDVYRMAAEPR